jgi:acetyl esterase
LKKRTELGARPSSEYDAPGARKASVVNARPFKKRPAAVAKKEDRTIKGPAGPIPVRVYTPRGKGPFPVVVYLHGGGWVLGSVELSDESASLLAKTAPAVVVSVDYRLSPEHKFPAAPEDCYAAVVWASKNAKSLGGDPKRLVVCGDSAGGNLSAAVALMARERGGPAIALQLLVYPLVDFTRDMKKFAKAAYGPTPTDCAWYIENYFTKGSEKSDARASPLFADLRGLPPAAIITAQYDTFTEQAGEYARKLTGAGVKVAKREYKGMMHGFWGYPGYFDLGREAIEWGALQVRKVKPS